MAITNQNQITAAFSQEFHRGFYLACQQKESRFQGAVNDRGQITGASFTINGLGQVTMRKRDASARFGATPLTIPESGTRICMLGDYDVYVPLEPFDLPKLLANPSGPYMDLMVAAANRAKDAEIFRALGADIFFRQDHADMGTADAGASGTTTATVKSLPASQKIGDTVTANAKTITLDDLLSAKVLFRANECDEQNGEQLFIAYNSSMLRAILTEDKLTSADYAAFKALQAGKLEAANNLLGFNWIPYEMAGNTGANAGSYSTYAWAKSGVDFGTGINYNTDVGPRRDLSNIIQMAAQASYGAGRSDEKKVVQINFK